jgi:hypothetical protein
MRFGSRHRWARVALGGFVGLAIVMSCAGTSARADDDDEDVAPDTKFFRHILQGLGLRRDGSSIDYRERSPLVLPPGKNLPAPDTAAVAEKTPAWPTDPDVKRAKEAKAARNKPRKTIDEESMPELPSQLSRRSATVPAGQRPTGDSKDPTAPSLFSELGSKSIFTLGGLLGSNEEYTTFSGEPARSSLTEPPTGYRTPSPAQPYGVGKKKHTDTAINPMDTPGMRGTDR